MPHRPDLREKVRTVGLVSSFVAVAAIGLTLVMDNGRSVFVGWAPRSERLFLLLLAAGICLLQIFLRIQRSHERIGRAMQQILNSIGAEAHVRHAPIEFEMAYQARVAIARIRFAIKQIEQFAPQTDLMREIGLQLLDAMQSLESADRSFLNRLRIPNRLQSSHTRVKGLNGQAAQPERLGIYEGGSEVTPTPRRSGSDPSTRAGARRQSQE